MTMLDIWGRTLTDRRAKGRGPDIKKGHMLDADGLHADVRPPPPRIETRDEKRWRKGVISQSSLDPQMVCAVTSGCKIHRPEWNAISLWRGRETHAQTLQSEDVSCVLGSRGLGGVPVSRSNGKWSKTKIRSNSSGK